MVASLQRSTDLELIIGSEEEFCVWIGNATPGDRAVYHRGFLMIDIEEPSRMGFALKKLQKRAHLASRLGLIHLLQRRLADGVFEYIAVARPSPARRGDSSPGLVPVEGDDVGIIPTHSRPRHAARFSVQRSEGLAG